MATVSWINSKTEIANLALDLVGGENIQSYDSAEASLEWRAVRQHYDQARDFTLRKIAPNFAVKRVALARHAEAPAFGATYQYIIPSDMVAAISLNNNHVSEPSDIFRIEAASDGVRVLLSNEEAANLRYIFRNDIPANYDAGFVEAFASQLAARMAFKITGDAAIQANLYRKAEIDLTSAITEARNEAKEPIARHDRDSKHWRSRRASDISV